MIYIVEGADGVGKTTLAEEISTQLKAANLHCSYKSGWNMLDYHTAMIQCAEAINDLDINVVLDRWAPSEKVYASVFREKESYDTDSLIKYYYPMLEITWIYCRNDNAVSNHLENKKIRPEMFESMVDVVNEFDAYIQDHKWMKWIVYDYNKVDMEEFVKGLPR